MNVVKILRQRVAAELNHLYTVPPFPTANGVDAGWSAREHALHAFFVARLLGAPADLRSGDFAVLSQALPPLTSLDTGVEHSWCAIDGVVPVDLSMTFAFLERAPQLKTAIAGEGGNGDWQVRYARDESLLDDKIENENEIIFIEKQIHAGSEEALLDNPYLFLPSPRIGDTASWHAFFGPDIYAKISLHCFRCAGDESNSLQNRLPRQQAVAWIASNYPAPEAQIRKELKP